MILDGNLFAGDRLPVEKDLAARLSVSRGSLREGVRALSVLGVVESRHGDGTDLSPDLLVAPLGLMVALQTARGSLHVHAVRRALETEAAGLAAAGQDSGTALDDARAALGAATGILAPCAHLPNRATAGERVDHRALLAANIAFHRALARASGSPMLAALVVRTLKHRLSRGTADPLADARALHEHEAVLAAVVAGDAERARVRMAAHLLEVEDSLRPS